MITLILVLRAVAIVFLQVKLAPTAIEHLVCEHKFDMKLAEPGEKITCHSTLINAWRFPVLYINFVEHMPESARIIDSRNNVDKHRLYLLPKQKYSHDIVFTLPQRGVYKKGKYYLEAGDFLGFSSKVESREISCDIVVMPEKNEDENVIEALGGFLGDHSVRRFIIEDPVLTVGYRDYTGKEPMKDISWNASARANKLLVKRNDYTVDNNVAVILNMKTGVNREMEECLKTVRTVCEKLEEERIPYRFISNGDVGELSEGLGSLHFNHLMMKLGKSSLFSYHSLDKTIEKCLKDRKNNRGYIIITPEMDESERQMVDKLQNISDHPLCVLTMGKENSNVNN